MSKIYKILPCIYLYDGKVVNSLNDKNVIDNDPLAYAKRLNELNVNDILVYDMSEGMTDADHETALDIIKDICNASDASIIGTGNIKRMEDVKKLLYAGCQKVAISYIDKKNHDILAEVSDKFGANKIFALYSDVSIISECKDELTSYVSELLYFSDKEDDLGKNTLDLPINLVVSNFKDDAASYEASIKKAGLELFSMKPGFKWDELKKNSDGLIPVIVQDYKTDEVLMLAYMNEEAYNKTLETGKMTYFSRSRNELWIKGETSSHYQYVKSLYADCDLDTILAKVKQIGAACHTGKYSCFFNEIAKKDYVEKNPQKILQNVFDVINDRKVNPKEGSYTNYLFDKGIDKILKKVGEEATEIVIAAKNPNSNEVVYEMSDFLYHMMVLMAEKNVSWEDITSELARR